MKNINNKLKNVNYANYKKNNNKNNDISSDDKNFLNCC